VRGARVLDAAAGSGALGFEALSRGAREAVFVEADRRVSRVLESNVRATRVGGRAAVVVRTVAAFLRLDRPSGFDVVFFDPPWADPVAGELEGLWGTLSPEGIFVVERGGGRDPWPRPPVAPEVRRYGTTTLFLYRRSGEPTEGLDGRAEHAPRPPASPPEEPPGR
jgi:16S rRNA (guanine966-N2)-methyltransferase